MSSLDPTQPIESIFLKDLAETYGTPLFVYDTGKIKQQYQRLTAAFPYPTLKVKYACKALSNLRILGYLKDLGAGLDAVSLEEVHLGLKAGFKPEDIIYTPNCVSFEEMKQAVALNVQINIDSISVLEQFGHTFGSTVPVCIRLNPHIMAGGHHKISTGHIDSKFGISIAQFKHAYRIIQHTGLVVNGIHMHTGSDILDAEVFLQGADVLLEYAAQFPNLQFIDFGSGFKVAYQEGDATTDIEELGIALGEKMRDFIAHYGKEVEIWFEPGKFLVSEAGYFLVRANQVKPTMSTVFVGVNSGQNHLIRPMYYDAYHHITNISHPEGKPRIYSVVGYICETDTFAWDRKIAEIREGDVLCFSNAGAYGFSMASNYNSRLRPAEVWIKDGKAACIRRAETLEDLLRTQEGLEVKEAKGTFV